MFLKNFNKYIVIEGNIGVGKTTLAQSLSNIYKGSVLLEEFNNNKFLKEFYDFGRYTFEMEMQFLIDRSFQISKFFSRDHSIIFSDFHIDKSLMFSKMNLPKTSFDILKQTHKNLFSQFPKPDLIIYLEGSLDSILNNIKKRNRSYEQKFSKEYLEKIAFSYINWLENIKTPVFKISSNKLIFKDSKEIKNIFSSIF